MKKLRVSLLIAGALTLTLLPLAASADDGGLELEPSAQRTHGWICYTHHGTPYLHVCVP